MKNVGLILLLLMISSGKVIWAMDNTSIQKAYQKSYDYTSAGNYKDAIKALSEVQKAYPNGYVLNLKLGQLFILNHKYANASQHFITAQKTAPYSMSPLLGQMKIANIQGHYSKTEELGYTVLQTDYFNYYGNLYLAHALRLNKKFDTANEINLKMLALYPEDLLFILEYALAQIGLGNITQANESLHFVLTLDPENVTAKEYLPRTSKKKEASTQ